jgi:hypothetical protein
MAVLYFIGLIFEDIEVAIRLDCSMSRIYWLSFTVHCVNCVWIENLIINFMHDMEFVL